MKAMLCSLALLVGCSSTSSPMSGVSRSSGGSGGEGASQPVGGGGTVVSPSGGGGGSISLIVTDAGTVDDASQTCVPTPVGRLRDFRADDGGHLGHPDFEKQSLFRTMDYDKLLGYPEKGISLAQLGSDQKPVFSGGTFKTVTSGATFDQWYRDVPNVNLASDYTLPLALDPTTNTLVYDTTAFFPLDGQGYGNSGVDDDGKMHNFGFTFELHMKFVYAGGETFRFRGDDDMFVFIDGKLAIDLGGVHAPEEASVELDTLGLTKGTEYPIDIFQAERHTTQSNFRVETTLAFSNCEPIIIPK